MADVTIPPEPESDRAQLLLIAAFGLAVMLAVLALILNTAIFTENIATRGSDIIGGKDAAQYRSAAQSDVGSGIEFANYHNNSSLSAQNDSFEGSVESWRNGTAVHLAGSSRVANGTLKRHSLGARVYQMDVENFTDAVVGDESLEWNWTLASGVDGVRNVSFTIDIDGTDNDSAIPINELFLVNFTESTGSNGVVVRIYGDSDTNDVLIVDVDRNDGTDLGECTASAGSDREVNVSITGATVDGEDCEPLRFFNSLSTPFDVSFNNTFDRGLGLGVLPSFGDSRANGTFSLVVNNSSSVNMGKFHGSTPNDFDSTDWPDVEHAIYSATVSITYRSQRLHYVTEVRAAPGEQNE